MDTDPQIYIVISVGDGASIERLTRAVLLSRLNEDYYGSKERIFTEEDFKKERGPVDLLMRRGLYIIKGDVIAPTPKEVVKEWSLG